MLKITYYVNLKFSLKNNNSEIINEISVKNFMFYIYNLKNIFGSDNVKISLKNGNENIITLIKSPHLYKYSKHVLVSKKIKCKLDVCMNLKKNTYSFQKMNSRDFKPTNNYLLNSPQISYKKHTITYTTFLKKQLNM